MKKFSVSALCCVAACALCLGGCNKNADTTAEGASCSEKASCAEKSACCKEGEAKAGCCKEKAAQQN